MWKLLRHFRGAIVNGKYSIMNLTFWLVKQKKSNRYFHTYWTNLSYISRLSASEHHSFNFFQQNSPISTDGEMNAI